jgi:hypothetical protein
LIGILTATIILPEVDVATVPAVGTITTKPLNPPFFGGTMVSIVVVPVTLTKSLVGVIVAAEANVSSENLLTKPVNMFNSPIILIA